MSRIIELEQAAGKESASAVLSEFLASLQIENLPKEVVARTEEAFLDWFASALAGRGTRPVRILEQFAAKMGPAEGPSQILVSRKRTSPLFAALVNGAASHIAEQDDVHNGALFHPGTVVFPAVLAAAQDVGASGKDLVVASVVGYEASIRVGEFLGPSHYKVFHTTGTAGTLGASAGVARILGMNASKMQHALGSAGTQAAGLWEFLVDAADSKVLHAGKAAADGLLSAYIARDGFTGAQKVLEGDRGMAAGMSQKADISKLTERLGKRWTILECSYKVHACCRHTHPSADALLEVMRRENLKAEDIAHIKAHVHRGAIDVLGPVGNPETVHHSKFSMGFVLGLIALYGQAGVTDFTESTLHDPKVRAFLKRVEMEFDPAIDSAPGNFWGGWVEVTTRDGRHLEGRVPAAKGDPQNTLERSDLEAKAQRLAKFGDAATPDEVRQIISRVWNLHEEPNLGGLFLRSGS